MEVKARNVKEFSGLKQPGDFYLTAPNEEGVMHLTFLCPCGCGDPAGISLRRDGTKGPGNCTWTWDQNEEAPTCTPSILRRGGCKWHGYLTKGVFVSC
jgi:hypothetical protein